MLTHLLFVGFLAFGQSTRTVEDGYEKNSLIDVSIISKQQATKLFDKFRKSPQIPFNYPVDGCYARATEMALMAEEEKIQMAKVYADGYLRVKTGNKAYPFIEWGYHVAPVAYVKENNKVELMVFDPSLFSSPVPIQKWKEKMLADGKPKPAVKELYFGSRYQMWPRKQDPKKYAWQKQDLETTESILNGYSSISRAAVASIGFSQTAFETHLQSAEKWQPSNQGSTKEADPTESGTK